MLSGDVTLISIKELMDLNFLMCLNYWDNYEQLMGSCFVDHSGPLKIRTITTNTVQWYF